MKNYRNHYLLILVLCCAAIVGCSAKQADSEKANTEAAGTAQSDSAQTVAPTVSIAKVAMTEMVERLPISGTLIAKEEVYVNTRINGYAIEQLKVSVGDRVKPKILS